MKLYVNDVKQLGETVRKARKDQGLTQQQLAAVCGVGIRFIRELERGKESCHLGKSLKALRMLGMNISVEGHGDL